MKEELITRGPVKHLSAKLDGSYEHTMFVTRKTVRKVGGKTVRKQTLYYIEPMYHGGGYNVWNINSNGIYTYLKMGPLRERLEKLALEQFNPGA